VRSAVFPVCERFVGGRCFRATACAYHKYEPPARPMLSHYGATFSRFLSQFAPVVEQVPYLPDVAALEWARTAGFHAADAGTLSPEVLIEVDGNRLESATFEPHPATWLIESDYPVLTIWTVNQPGVVTVPPVDLSQAETVLVTRPGDFIEQTGLSAAQAVFVDALLEGRSLSDAAQHAAAAGRAFDLEAAVALCLHHGVFADARVPPR